MKVNIDELKKKQVQEELKAEEREFWRRRAHRWYHVRDSVLLALAACEESFLDYSDVYEKLTDAMHRADQYAAQAWTEYKTLSK